MAKHRILVITSFIPYPLISGGHQAIFNGLSIMRDYADVFLLVKMKESDWKNNPGREIEKILPFVKCIPFIEPESRHNLKWYLRALKHKLCSIAGINRKPVVQCTEDPVAARFRPVRDFRKDMAEFVNKVINKYGIDIVQAEMMSMLKVADTLPENVRKIFVHHELRFVRNELYLRSLGAFSGAMYEEWKKNKDEEVRALNKYDDIIVLSEVDARKLKEAGVTAPIVTSLATVSTQLSEHEMAKPKKTLTFVGPEYHYPNFVGMCWFLENCWRKLKETDPGFELNIIGVWSEETRQKISGSYDSVHFLGYVESLPDVLAGTTMIVPINIGSGIRMKILEAAIIGVPVVSTSVGAEGLPLEDSVHAFITDTPDSFVRDILLLQDEELQKSFVNNSRKIVADKYSFEALKNSREALYCH